MIAVVVGMVVGVRYPADCGVREIAIEVGVIYHDCSFM